MSENISNIYAKLFKHYLEFLPQYRRNLIESKEMHNWLKDLDFGTRLNNYSDFVIYLEFLNALNLLKPFCVANIPKPPEGTLNVIRTSNIDMLQEKGLISFPERIYNIRVSKEDLLKVKHWDHSKYELLRNDIHEGYITTADKFKYLYHPLQFFNLLTYLGNIYSNISQTKEYKEFYWKRKLLFDDYLVKKIKETVSEKGGTIEDYVKKQIESGSFSDQFLGIMLRQNRWLTPDKLELWIKIESIYQPRFLKPSSVHYKFLEKQASSLNKREESAKKINNWYSNLDENFKLILNKEDFHKIKEFRQKLEIYLRYDGLENFIDLFLMIKPEKKDKLKGRLSLFVNMIEFVRVLRIAENRLVSEYSDLIEFKTTPRWYDPQYFFESEEEYIEHTKKVLLDFDLFQEEKFVIFVEGETELILLEDWLNYIYSRTGVKISLKVLGSRRNAFIFEYLINKFDANEYFLVIDADKPEYVEGKKANLKGKGINEKSFYIFNPDFVTENFSIKEVITSFKNYIIDINNELESEKKYELSETDYKELERTLSSEKEKGFEKIIEKFMRRITKNDKFKLKKPKFAEKLLDEMRENFSIRKRENQYPFEKILGQFINEIQMRKFPEELKKK